MNYLELDLNEIASEQIKERISSLESQIKQASKTNNEYYLKNKSLEEKLLNHQNTNTLLDGIVLAYNSLKEIEKDKDGYGAKNIHVVRCEFVENILKSIFGLKSDGYYIGDRLTLRLAINYNSHKDIILALMKVLEPNNSQELNKIATYQLPKTWSKEVVMKFVKSPHSCTNGCYFGATQYWSGDLSGCPYDHLFRNPHILEDDIFAEVISNLKETYRSDFYWIDNYTDLTKGHIENMGNTLIGKEFKIMKGTDSIKLFIGRNMNKFNFDTLNYLYKFISHDNMWNFLFYEQFPMLYQQKYLSTLPFFTVLNLLNSNKKWSDLEKEEFLKMHLNQVKS